MREVLDELGVRPLDGQRAHDLDVLGFCRFDNFLDAEEIAATLARIGELVAASGRQGGTLHVDNLLADSAVFDRLWLRSELLAAAAHHLGDGFRLTSMGYRAGLPGHGAQALHTDLTNAIVALTDFTPDNGATRVVPGSHLMHGFRAPGDDHDRPHPDQCLLLGPAGTCWLFRSDLWHSGTRNQSTSPRHAVLTGFALRPTGSALALQALQVMPTDDAIERLGTAAYLLM